jgi:two-component system, response regulator YesN
MKKTTIHFIHIMDEARTIQEIETELFLQPLSNLVAKLNYSRRLERCWKLIEVNYSDSNLDLEKAAKVSGISKNHLNILLRKTTAFTFHQLLTRYRLLRAMAMIMTRNYSLAEIAVQNGFGSLVAFQRNFQSILGDTPRRFRKKSGLSI